MPEYRMFDFIIANEISCDNNYPLSIYNDFITEFGDESFEFDGVIKSIALKLSRSSSTDSALVWFYSHGLDDLLSFPEGQMPKPVSTGQFTLNTQSGQKSIQIFNADDSKEVAKESIQNISETNEHNSADLYNQAISASQEGDYDAAISLLDDCLCNDPEPGLAMLAYWNMAVTILMKFNFQERNGEDVSDEEMKWCQRMLICSKKIKSIYESHLKNHPEYSKSHYETYEQSKNLYNSYTFYGSVYRDNSGSLSQRSMKNVAHAPAKPLRCFADEEGA